VLPMNDSYLQADGNTAGSPTENRVQESSAALVQIDNVTKKFGCKVALKDVSFSVPFGQICGLLGPNGAGKTTLFRLLMGILKATEGKLLIDGCDAFEEVFVTMRRIAPIAAKLRLSTDLDNYAEDYSRGMKKKLGLLLAMLHEPKLLVLDEPTNGGMANALLFKKTGRLEPCVILHMVYNAVVLT
jgi:ABC-type multidrug transport system ATPase subunit